MVFGTADKIVVEYTDAGVNQSFLAFQDPFDEVIYGFFSNDEIEISTDYL